MSPAKTRIAWCLAALCLPAALAAQQPAAEPSRPLSLAELLERVKQGYRLQTEADRQREAEFTANKDRQAALLKAARAELAAEQKRSEGMEKEFDRNEASITQLQETLRIRLGTMGELFGMIRQMAGDTRAQLEASLVGAQFPGRAERIDPLAKSKSLPSIPQLEEMWYLLLQEMTESGKVVRFEASVVSPDGQERRARVMRVGVFNTVVDGRYANWAPEVGKLVELGRQPGPQYLTDAAGLESATQGYHRFALDPARGSILALLVQTPDFIETLPYGGVIGYTVLGLGAVTALVAILRLVWLFVVGFMVRRQRRREAIKTSNPLGRVLKVYADNPAVDLETLQHKLDEAILRETSRLERVLSLVKVVAVVAPLMGLLGTITGMIKTFNAITLFGSGDPKLMAGGISEALVTTEEGLIVAIPLVLLHAWLKSQVTSVVDVLEEQSAGLVARRAEALMKEAEHAVHA
jgi:biopolymer transport protein ExbB